MPQKSDRIVRVFCGENDEETEVLLQVIVFPAEKQTPLVPALGSTGYILTQDNHIIVSRNGEQIRLVDGTKRSHAEILTKVQALADEVTTQLDTRIFKPTADADSSH